MTEQDAVPKRFIGLDIHKRYLVAVGVDADLNPVLGPQRVEYTRLGQWMTKTLRSEDALVIEMTTNTWQMYEDLLPHVQSVTVVHPPHVALITRSQVMNDKIAASILARLLAKGLLVGIWVPPQPVRDARALIAQRSKMTRLATQSKNRLHAVLHRRQTLPPEGSPFLAERRAWWLALPLNATERARVECDLDTLEFAQKQVARLDETIHSLAALDERTPLLTQLPGVGILTATTILAAIGEIGRFPSDKKLVGYAGLGGRLHESGMSSRKGSITKAGRRDLRAAMVEAAQTAANTHPHWKAELARLEPRLGRNKAIVAIARKLLVAVWHILTKQEADRFAQPEIVARKLMQCVYKLGKPNRPAGLSTAQLVRQQLDSLGLGADLTSIAWGPKKKPLPLPPSNSMAIKK
jgi:transposase